MTEQTSFPVPTPEVYVEQLYIEKDEQLEKVKESIRANDMPEISIAPGYGRLLTMLVRMSGAKQILEIGALGGYSGICLARGLSEVGRLISLEIEPKFAELAHSNLKEAGLGQYVEYRVGDALQSLEQLASMGEKFDFFFIDADKGNYVNYLEWSLKLANPGAIIAGDNALMHGKVLDSKFQSPSIKALREFNHRIASDPRLESTILPSFDGLALARVK